MRKPSPAMIVALGALFVALSGVGVAATGGNFILGQSNTADKATALTVSTLPSATSCPAPCQAFQVTDNSTAANAGGLGVLSKSASTPAATIKNTGGATALSLLVNSGKPPFAVNSTTKVANLNADTLDGRDSTFFLPAAAIRNVGPITTTPTGDPVQIAAIGQLTFFGQCPGSSGGNEDESLNIFTSADHAAYADATFGSTGTAFGNADMNFSNAGVIYTLADLNNVPDGTPAFTPVNGEAVSADGHEIFYNLYMGLNARGTTGDRCIFGGSFTVK